MTGRHPKPFI